MAEQELIGFWEVVGHKPRKIYSDIIITSSTFALEKMAIKFAESNGGTVRHIKADGILVGGRFRDLTMK